jgi:hypothetical protein
MGGNNANPQNVNKQQKTEAKQQIVQKRIDEINVIQNSIAQFPIQTTTNSNVDTQISVLLDSNFNMNNTLKIAETQMKRADMPLTKADLIAIIIAISPQTYGHKLTQLQTLTCGDLNVIIRSTIYDPNNDTFEYICGNTFGTTASALCSDYK